MDKTCFISALEQSRSKHLVDPNCAAQYDVPDSILIHSAALRDPLRSQRKIFTDNVWEIPVARENAPTRDSLHLAGLALPR
jgi:hypothetical protein